MRTSVFVYFFFFFNFVPSLLAIDLKGSVEDALRAAIMELTISSAELKVRVNRKIKVRNSDM